MNGLFFKLLDKNSPMSSKRFVGVICLHLIVIGFLASLIFKCEVNEMVFKTIEYLVIASMLGTVAEKYINKDTKEQPKVEE